MTLLLLVAVSAFFFALLLGMAGYERLALPPEPPSRLAPDPESGDVGPQGA
jgi:hypothetical protein